jgi:hypothetical protein
MTTCRTPQSGGVSGAPARTADKNRIDSVTQLPRMPARPHWRVPAARRAQPPDFETLVRVRDGLKRL